MTCRVQAHPWSRLAVDLWTSPGDNSVPGGRCGRGVGEEGIYSFRQPFYGGRPDEAHRIVRTTSWYHFPLPIRSLCPAASRYHRADTRSYSHQGYIRQYSGPLQGKPCAGDRGERLYRWLAPAARSKRGPPRGYSRSG